MRAILLLAILFGTRVAIAGICEDLANRVCEKDSGTDVCSSFIDGKLVGPDGKPLSQINRLLACKLAVDDVPTLDNYRSEFARHITTDRFSFTVWVDERRQDGKAWDLRDPGVVNSSHPDIAACIGVDYSPIGCVPQGQTLHEIQTAKCHDSVRCPFWVRTHRGASVTVQVVDVDGETAELIGDCTFETGNEDAVCAAGVRLEPDYVKPRGASSIVDSRLVATWTVGQMPFPEFIDAAKGAMSVTIEFTNDGRLILAIDSVKRKRQYNITGIEGTTIVGTTNLRDKDEPFKITIRGDQLNFTLGSLTADLHPWSSPGLSAEPFH